jgi:hypothetical protein
MTAPWTELLVGLTHLVFGELTIGPRLCERTFGVGQPVGERESFSFLEGQDIVGPRFFELLSSSLHLGTTLFPLGLQFDPLRLEGGHDGIGLGLGDRSILDQFGEHFGGVIAPLHLMCRDWIVRLIDLGAGYGGSTDDQYTRRQDRNRLSHAGSFRVIS